MYVCLCKQVTDGDIRAAVETEGASSMRDLRRQLGVATCCGCCAPCAREVLAVALQEREQALADDALPVADSALQPG